MTDLKVVEPEILRIVEPLFFTEENGRFPASPKQLCVQPVRVQTACVLNRLWHSRFPLIDWSNVVRNKRYVCFSAQYDGLFYAVAIWSSPIAAHRLKNGDRMLELRRMAISSDAPKNTASFMLKVMRKWIEENFREVDVLISYQDKDAHRGTIYKASNWIPVAQSPAGMSWQDTRERSNAQSTASKIRWEYRIRSQNE